MFDDIKASRNTDWINNFWKALANHPPTLRRTWESLKEVMAPGALDPLTKELIYLAVSVSNGCQYCTASHGAAAKRLGMTPEMLGELLAVVGDGQRDQPAGRRLSGSGRRALRKPVLMKPHGAGASPPAPRRTLTARRDRAGSARAERQRREGSWRMSEDQMPAQFDREAENLGNVTMLEHVNVEIPNQALASNFYLVGLRLYARSLSVSRHQQHVGQYRQEPVPPADRRRRWCSAAISAS